MEDLQGDGAVVPQILGEKNGGHTATPELPLDAVVISQ